MHQYIHLFCIVCRELMLQMFVTVMQHQMKSKLQDPIKSKNKMSRFVRCHVSALHLNIFLGHFTSPIPLMLWFSPLSYNNLPFLILTSFPQEVVPAKQGAQRKTRNANFHLSQMRVKFPLLAMRVQIWQSKMLPNPFFSSFAEPLQWAWSTSIISSPGNWSLNLAQGCAIKTMMIF